jgi:hypothetical protein
MMWSSTEMIFGKVSAVNMPGRLHLTPRQIEAPRGRVPDRGSATTVVSSNPPVPASRPRLEALSIAPAGGN